LTGSTVWRHDGVEVLSVANKSASRSGSNEEEESTIKGFLVNVLSTPYFYFSYDADLTQTQQRLFPLLSDENVQQVRQNDMFSELHPSKVSERIIRSETLTTYLA